MKKSKCEKVCEICGNLMNFNGKDKNGIQKYKCPKCGYSCQEIAKFTSGRRAHRLLSLLFNIMKNDFYGEKELGKMFNKAMEDPNPLRLKNIYYRRLYRNLLKADAKTEKKGFMLNCNNPKLLICLNDNDDIVFYELPNIKNEPYIIKVLDREGFKYAYDNENQYSKYQTFKSRS